MINRKLLIAICATLIVGAMPPVHVAATDITADTVIEESKEAQDNTGDDATTVDTLGVPNEPVAANNNYDVDAEAADILEEIKHEADRIESMIDYAQDINSAAMPVTVKPSYEAEYIRDFEYSQNIVMSGIYETNSYYFETEKYQDIQYVYAQLEVELSQLLYDVPATLSFAVNGMPVASYKMDYRNGKNQTMYVEVPVDMLKTGFNSFEISGYARTSEEYGCVDEFANINWVSIKKGSYIQVGYSLVDYQNNINYYPYPFISSMDTKGENLEIVVSDKCETSEMATALVLRADLSNETEKEDLISLVKYSDSGKDVNRILVARTNNIPAEFQAVVSESKSGIDLSNSAMVLITGELNKNITMIITSDNDDCLAEVAMMLMDEDRVSQEKTNIAVVHADSSKVMRDYLNEKKMEVGKYTLDSFREDGLSFVGPFHQAADIYLPFSGGYVLADSGKIVLKFRYSENLDFNRSMVTVFWGDVPVASKKLLKENAGGDELAFVMPNDVIGTSATKISIAFELEIPDMICTPNNGEMPWAYVSKNSSFYLPTGTENNYTFSMRPYPFEIASRYNGVLVVLPDNMTATEMETIGRLISIYGENILPYGDLKVVYASGFNEAEAKEKNLVVVGTYQDNNLIKSLNDKMHFAYQADGKAFMSNKELIMSDNYAKDIGTLQLIYSPYADDKAVLMAAAIDDMTMKNIDSFMRLDENVWKFEKDTVLIDSDMEIKTFKIAEPRDQERAPILKTVMEENHDAAMFTIVAAAVMVLILLSVILILIRIYIRKKK